MATTEFKSEHRISKIMKSLGMRPDDVRQVYYAFDKLVILKKHMPDSYRAKNRVTFSIGKDEYMERMMWINTFMRAHGMNEDVFRDVTDFDVSSTDYDFYNEYKTPTEYQQEEAERPRKQQAPCIQSDAGRCFLCGAKKPAERNVPQAFNLAITRRRRAC